METKDNAINQYLGSCNNCGEYGAMSNTRGLCAKCRLADDKEMARRREMKGGVAEK